MTVAPTRPRVLTWIAHYLPGTKFGGPVRAVHHLTDALADEVDFRIVTSDRDFRDRTPFADVVLDEWVSLGRARVQYLSPRRRTLRGVIRLLKEESYDAVYLNSFFAPRFSIQVLLAMHLMRARERVILAPRGEFAQSALRIKPIRKTAYLWLAHRLGWYDDVTWHASSSHEAEDVRRLWGRDARVVLAPEIVHVGPAPAAMPPRRAALRAVFIGRVARVKNLDGALRILRSVEVPVEYDVYGAMEDRAYETECRELAATLPSHVRVRFHGSVDETAVRAALADSDVLLLPTHGENYGHAIVEALAAGCPALISDQTPWHGLAAAKAGWDLSLSDEAGFARALASLFRLTDDQRSAMRAAARRYALEHAAAPDVLVANRSLFTGAGHP